MSRKKNTKWMQFQGQAVIIRTRIIVVSNCRQNLRNISSLEVDQLGLVRNRRQLLNK